MYVGQVSNQIARLFCSIGVMTHIRPYNTIRASLRCDPKTGSLWKNRQVWCTPSNVPTVLHLIGETERPALAKRLKEHRRPESPVCEHMTEESH